MIMPLQCISEALQRSGDDALSVRAHFAGRRLDSQRVSSPVRGVCLVRLQGAGYHPARGLLPAEPEKAEGMASTNE